ncbi:MAG: hypothetical protein UT84_C0003G0019 [Candidatus Curtissbacteria bacterium GW2011_GWA1_40_16]|uniref:Uncharacterized protein n=1 Tax=Candidatus Curtissbacteria bacterium GW2011_GWA1_40_16 TaxID=1618405 RepID=A0A0G0RE81_9BACT|nr:MAG: hypothetical protein UT84_C0003G0019 [Candidatus Curtissbacteria bacterium GW2011_GWA1_40_16]
MDMTRNFMKIFLDSIADILKQLQEPEISK